MVLLIGVEPPTDYETVAQLLMGFKQTEKAAHILGIEIQLREVRGPDNSQKALEVASDKVRRP
jgi:hypothetical protein